MMMLLTGFSFPTQGTLRGVIPRRQTPPFTLCSWWRGEGLFLATLERIQTLYPGSYAWGATSTIPPGPEARKGPHKVRDLELDGRTHMGAARFDLFLGGVDPSPIRARGYVGVHYDLLSVTRGFLDGLGSVDHGGMSTYRGQMFANAGLLDTSPPPASEGGNPWKNLPRGR